VNNTFLGSKASGTQLSSLDNTSPDYTVSLSSINTRPELVKSGGSYFNSNILLIGGFAILIGVGIYYYYQYQKITKEENKYQ
jgi:Ca2+/Na+ antiporter